MLSLQNNALNCNEWQINGRETLIIHINILLKENVEKIFPIVSIYSIFNYNKTCFFYYDRLHSYENSYITNIL